MENQILESYLRRPVQAGIAHEEIQMTVSHLQDLMQYEYTTMLFYLQASYAVPEKKYYFDYFGHKNKDVHFQIRCHSMHNMRHAEMLGRTVVRLGQLPSLEMRQLPEVKTYGEMMDTARRLEEDKLSLYRQYLGSVSDSEIYLMFSNHMRENEIHAALNQQLMKLMEGAGLAGQSLPDTQGKGEDADDVAMLQRAFYLEAYSIIHLIYLSVCLGFDQSLAPRLRALSIEHMKHLSKIGIEIQALNALPQVPLKVSFIEEDQYQTNSLLEKNLRIVEQKAAEMGEFVPKLKNKKARQVISEIIPKELENASDLRAYLGSLESARRVH